MSNSCSVILAFAAFITGTQAHSWIHCSDYRGDRRYYDPDMCFGHPRPINGRVPQQSLPFGLDTGFNQQPEESCHTGPASNSPAFPMARYKQGQRVVLAWPSKNHVAAVCTNAYIPDTSLELFVAPLDADGHPDEFTQVKASFSDVPHEKGKMDFEGFQKCPAFCENMDKSLCTGTFHVPENLADGLYTFQWKWEFNENTAPYITCFDAYIGQDVAPVPAPTPAPTKEGQTPSPTVEVTEDNCTLAVWSACGGEQGVGGCCANGITCYRQSQYYSQCRPDCPTGWECAEDSTPTPPPASPTPSPTVSTPNTPSPTVEPEEPCSADLAVDSCPDGFGSRAKLVKPTGAFAYTATVEDACSCAHFCRLFNPLATAWHFSESKAKCTCYASYKKLKNSKKDWAGVISDLAEDRL